MFMRREHSYREFSLVLCMVNGEWVTKGSNLVCPQIASIFINNCLFTLKEKKNCLAARPITWYLQVCLA
jgi:hypothetical protein